MIETIVNAVQLGALLFCSAVSLSGVYRTRDEKWLLLFLFYAGYFLGDLYWQMYLVFYHRTPVVFYVSDLSWYAGYLFLYLLLQRMTPPGIRRFRDLRLRLLPVFCCAMCLFYMHEAGDYFGNVISALLMSFLLFQASKNLMYLRKTGRENPARFFYVLVLVFCALEYAGWTASCFWMGDTFANPYLWFDCLLTVAEVLFLQAVEKVVA